MFFFAYFTFHGTVDLAGLAPVFDTQQTQLHSEYSFDLELTL